MYLSRAIKKSSITVKATGRQTSEGFVVLKGSIISPDDDNTIPPGVKNCVRHLRLIQIMSYRKMFYLEARRVQPCL